MSEFRPNFHLLRLEEVVAGAEFAPSLESRSQPQLRRRETPERDPCQPEGGERFRPARLAGRFDRSACWCAIHMPQRNVNECCKCVMF